jgi:peptidyl-prolyl cis-trans isomerase C
VNVAEDDAAKAKAEDIRHRVLAGEPFAKLAAEVSDDPSKANGGLIGPIKSDELSETLADTLLKMKVGDVSEPLRMQRGYQIFTIESRTEQKVKTFDEARQDISDRIADEKRRTETQKYIEKLRASASITWHNDELKKAYEQALAERQKQLAGAEAGKPTA